MGGFGALRLSMKYPEVFSAVYGLSPCCLAWEEELSDKNPMWRRAMQVTTPAQLGQTLRQGDPYSSVFVALAAAFSPNIQRPSLYVDWPFRSSRNNDGKLDVRVRDKTRGHSHEKPQPTLRNQLVPNKLAYKRWQQNFPVNMIPQYQQNLTKVNHIVLNYGTKDQPVNVSTSTRAFSRELAKNDIPHKLEVFEGRLKQRMRDRLANHVFPFFSRTLHFEKP